MQVQAYQKPQEDLLKRKTLLYHFPFPVPSFASVVPCFRRLVQILRPHTHRSTSQTNYQTSLCPGLRRQSLCTTLDRLEDAQDRCVLVTKYYSNFNVLLFILFVRWHAQRTQLNQIDFSNKSENSKIRNANQGPTFTWSPPREDTPTVSVLPLISLPAYAPLPIRRAPLNSVGEEVLPWCVVKPGLTYSTSIKKLPMISQTQ